MEDNGVIRKFETGATRDTSANKNDYEGFLSPLVIEAFGDYMSENRVQKDGSLRASDNWQKGIPKDVYVKSAFRHFMQFWKLHRGLACVDENGKPVDLKHAVGGLLFNIMGYMHESLKPKSAEDTFTNQELRDEIAKVKASPEFPRFFSHVHISAPYYSPCLYVMVSPKVGCCYYLDNYGWTSHLNWTLDNLLSATGWCDIIPPVEIPAAEAVLMGLPNQTCRWPVELLKHWPGGTSRIPANLVLEKFDTKTTCGGHLND